MENIVSINFRCQSGNKAVFENVNPVLAKSGLKVTVTVVSGHHTHALAYQSQLIWFQSLPTQGSISMRQEKNETFWNDAVNQRAKQPPIFCPLSAPKISFTLGIPVGLTQYFGESSPFDATLWSPNPLLNRLEYENAATSGISVALQAVKTSFCNTNLSLAWLNHSDYVWGAIAIAMHCWQDFLV